MSRNRVLSVLSAFAFVLVAFPATAFAGTSEDVVRPPGPSCADPIYTTPAVLDANGYNQSVRLGDGSNELPVTLAIPGQTFEAGAVSLDEVITWDSHIDRETNTDQLNERVVIDFLLNGAVVGTSDASPDLADGVDSAWEISNLGVVNLPDGADAVNLRHVAGTTQINSVVVTSVCVTFVAVATCEDGTAEGPNGCEQAPDCEETPDAEGCPQEPDCDVDPDAEGCPEPPATCEDGSVEGPDGCDQAPEPDPNPNPPLAITGAYSDLLAAGGMIFVLTGALVTLVANRRED